MSRNQKATVLASGFYVLALAFFLWGAMLSQETRVRGTIGKRQIDIPVYLQNEPEYAGLKDTKVYPGWGGGRLILWGLLGLGCGVTGLVLSNERRAELVEERIKYQAHCREVDQQAKLNSAYRLTLDQKIKERTGEAALTLHEDNLEAEIDSIRELNGWVAPDRPEPSRPLPAPQLRSEPIAPPPNSPEDLKAKLEALAAAARDRLNSNEGDRPESNRPDSTATDGSYKLYQERGEKVMRSLASLKMSILSAAPTGAGKTHTLYRWLGDLQTLYPQNEVYVIAHKRDSFLGLLEQGRVNIFKSLAPEISLDFLNKVYAEMERRLDEPEGDRKKFEKMPVRLVLDDWYASCGALKNYPALWNIVRTQIGDIITKGREANVCLYVATQSFNLEALGIQDSNIRGNLAITCQGLVTEKLDDYGEQVEQGGYESLQLLIGNKFIVGSKEDRERLNAELEEIIALSKKYQVPAIFCAIGKNILALAPYYQKPIVSKNSGSTNAAVTDSNNEDELPKISDEDARRWRMEWLMKNESPESQSQSQSLKDDAQNNDRISISASEQSELTQSEQSEQGEMVGWYRWLPSKAEVIKLLEETDGNLYNFSSVVRSKLKKTETTYNKKTKNAIVELLLTLERFDLIAKYEIDAKKYPID